MVPTTGTVLSYDKAFLEGRRLAKTKKVRVRLSKSKGFFLKYQCAVAETITTPTVLGLKTYSPMHALVDVLALVLPGQLVSLRALTRVPAVEVLATLPRTAGRGVVGTFVHI